MTNTNRIQFTTDQAKHFGFTREGEAIYHNEGSAKNAGLRLAADYVVDNNGDLDTTHISDAKGLGREVYGDIFNNTGAQYIYRELTNEWVIYTRKAQHTIPAAVVAPVVPLPTDSRELLATTVHTATPAQFTKAWDQAAVNAALTEQVQAFGTADWGVKGIHTSYKIAKKEAVLDRTLRAAFTPRAARNSEALSLDTQKDSSWTPTTADPLEALAEAEVDPQAKRNAILNRLTGKQREIAILLEEGNTQQAIANTLGVSQVAVHKSIKGIRAKLAR